MTIDWMLDVDVWLVYRIWNRLKIFSFLEFHALLSSIAVMVSG